MQSRTSWAVVEEDLSETKKFLNHLVDSEALSGKVKTAIDDKITNHQIPLLTAINDVTAYMNIKYGQAITKFKETVRESSDEAKIDSDVLTTMEEKFSDVSTDFTEIDESIKKIYKTIDDLVVLTNVATDGFEEQLGKTKKVLTNTKKWLGDFNGLKEKSHVTELLNKINAEIAQLNTAGEVSYTSGEAAKFYHQTDFKKYVKTEHAQAKKDLEKFNAKYDKAQYAWEKYSNSEIGKALNQLINVKKNGISGWLAKYHLDAWLVRGKNIKNLIEGLQSLYDKTGGRVGKLGKYGKRGYRAGVRLDEAKRLLLSREDQLGKYARKANSFGKSASQKMKKVNYYLTQAKKWGKGKAYNLKSVRNLSNYLSKHPNLKGFLKHPVGTAWEKSLSKMKASKSAQKVAGTMSQLKKSAKVQKLMKTKGYKWGTKKFSKANGFTKYGKFGKIATRAGYVSMAFDVGKSAVGSYHDKKSLAYKSKGKAVIHAGVDQIKQAGPLEVAMAFSKLGPAGVAFGFGDGLTNSVVGILNSKLKDKFYNGMEKGLDKGYDQTVKKAKKIGRGIKKSFKNIKHTLNLGW
ncbi:T7SS effector LXG polymorphic toxin [Ligilactobacillus pobuzihii]|uniref:T7SS effector LXG polymorphic toxin n=1 Tax=Ligilactobacillus pobuzihii TaxID=449659 RepID=UPI001CDD1E41|nr:T7SS effector LXG polymorphic toxin [Ligilactobacillus pobuzihii]